MTAARWPEKGQEGGFRGGKQHEVGDSIHALAHLDEQGREPGARGLRKAGAGYSRVRAESVGVGGDLRNVEIDVRRGTGRASLPSEYTLSRRNRWQSRRYRWLPFWPDQELRSRIHAGNEDDAEDRNHNARHKLLQLDFHPGVQHLQLEHLGCHVCKAQGNRRIWRPTGLSKGRYCHTMPHGPGSKGQ